MTDTDPLDGFADFVNRLHAADGLPLRLEPWQHEYLDAMRAGTRIASVRRPRSAAMRALSDLIVAHAIATGTDVRVVARDADEAAAVYDRARALLQRAGIPAAAQPKEHA